jgi:hypothetical protein
MSSILFVRFSQSVLFFTAATKNETCHKATSLASATTAKAKSGHDKKTNAMKCSVVPAKLPIKAVNRILSFLNITGEFPTENIAQSSKESDQYGEMGESFDRLDLKEQPDK